MHTLQRSEAWCFHKLWKTHPDGLEIGAMVGVAQPYVQYLEPIDQTPSANTTFQQPYSRI